MSAGYLLPLGATAAAAGVTYFSCVRPMRRGKGCGMGMGAGDTSQCAPESQDSENTSAEIRALTEEIQLLRHEVDLRADRAVSDLEHR